MEPDWLIKARAEGRVTERTPPARGAELTLPFPPTVNTYWRHVGHKVLISKRGREYRKEVVALVRPMGLAGELSVSVDVHPPDRRKRDLDNLTKSLLDAMGAAGVYADDSQIAHLELRRKGIVEGGCVVVRVRTLEVV